MSSREPLWFCHECHAEMRPLMAPDPICASCRGTFVEKMDNTADDPRDFSHSRPMDPEGDEFPPELNTFFTGLQAFINGGLGEGTRRGSNTASSVPRLSFQIRTGSGQPDHVPTMSEFVRRGSGIEGGITGPVMAQYLMALLGNRDSISEFFGQEGGLAGGRLGDYVFNQEALDHIITQLMENSNAHRPVPAPEEVISNLPREVLEQGSPLLEKDCAVCKEQFKLETEDPDEQIVITLPCKHPFHEPCILPWLKSSGTCPVCRHALVPQPGQYPIPPSSSDPNVPRGFSGRSPPREPNNLLQSLFGTFAGGGSNSSGRNTGSSSRHTRTNSDPTSRSTHGSRPGNFPGGWEGNFD